MASRSFALRLRVLLAFRFAGRCRVSARLCMCRLHAGRCMQVRRQLQYEGVQNAAEVAELGWVGSLIAGVGAGEADGVMSAVAAIWDAQVSQLSAEQVDVLNVLAHLDAASVEFSLLAGDRLAGALGEASHLRASLSQSPDAKQVVRRIVRALERFVPCSLLVSALWRYCRVEWRGCNCLHVLFG